MPKKQSIITPKSFQKAILHWFDLSGRKTLPWQENKTPYRVWVSEIMLQQTQVSTVIPYYVRFMEKIPSIQKLAEAKEDAVLHLWTGLGYYSRARNLHRTAKIITEYFKGVFPSNLETVQSLPGIGRSTAGAILSIAFEKQAAILDGNVKRVLTRFLGIQEWPGEKKVLEQLWEFAEKYTPANRVADYSQAMMDLGATVCVRGKPLCEKCPLQKNCLAHSRGIEKNLPIAKPKKTIPVREKTFFILRNEKNEIFLEKRAPTGIWSGLWSLPEVEGFFSEKEIKKICQKNFSLTAKKINFKKIFRHTFSHFHLDILPVEITVQANGFKIMEDEQQIWYNVEQPANVGLPAPVKVLIEY
jgi:A/G-specific adenine glycosylase